MYMYVYIYIYREREKATLGMKKNEPELYLCNVA